MPTAPAQRLNFDILSVIFLLLWEQKVDSQLVVAAVCRHWRQVALANPRLWTRIYSDCRKPLYTSTYLTRSRNLPLHVSLSWRSSDDQIESLSTVTDRIVCLKHVMALYMLHKTFPVLERLEFGRSYGRANYIKLDPMALEVARYPKLRHLSMGDISGSWSCLLTPKAGFPPLQSLHIRCDRQPHWRNIITECAETLNFLSLVNYDSPDQGLPTDYSIREFEATLPRLSSFRMKEDDGHFPLKFDAPCLQSVHRYASSLVYYRLSPLVFLNAKSATDLAFRNTPVDTLGLTGIRTLWVQFDPTGFSILENRLSGVLDRCHLLESIRYAYIPMAKLACELVDKSEELEALIRSKVQAAGRIEITIERFDPADLELPGLAPRDATCNEIPCDEQ